MCEKCGGTKDLPHDEWVTENIVVWHCFSKLIKKRQQC